MLALLVTEVRVQLELEKDPPAPPSLQEIVPVGTVFVPLPTSATLAVKLTVLPKMTVAGFGVTLVEDGRDFRDEKIAVSFIAALTVIDAGSLLPV